AGADDHHHSISVGLAGRKSQPRLQVDGGEDLAAQVDDSGEHGGRKGDGRDVLELEDFLELCDMHTEADAVQEKRGVSLISGHRVAPYPIARSPRSRARREQAEANCPAFSAWRAARAYPKARSRAPAPRASPARRCGWAA